MTTFSMLSRFLRKYLFSVEALLLIFLALFLYHSVFHSNPIWNYIFRAKSSKSNVNVRKKVFKDVLPVEQKGKIAWEVRKDTAAVYAIQGRRPHMEDRFNIVTDFEHTDTSLYGIFDGHGGDFAADYTEKTLFKCIMIRLLKASIDERSENFTQMITDEVLRVDSQLLEIAKPNSDISGTTALFALLKGSILTVANVGDSRGVLCDKNGTSIPLSYDHKPYNMKERQRIKDAGGFISFNGVWRVAGILATSRALGDYPLKENKLVIAEPDILTFDLKMLQPQFMILASDGLWDVFSNQEAVDFIKERLDEPHFGAKSLVLQAYYKGSLDNISVLVVNFKKKFVSQLSR